MDRNHVDWDRLDRYVMGQGSPEERAALEAWVAADPELRAIAAAMQTVGRHPEAEQRTWDVAGAWQRVRSRMDRASLRVVSLADRRPARMWWLVGTAAAVVVLGAASLLTFTRWRAATPAVREVATRRAQTAVLNLADGSRIILGPASRVRLSVAPYARDVDLEGEAYLEVKHDSTRPFRVHTAAGVIQDVGTEFLVSAYPGAAGTRVVVASGSVALYQPSGRERVPPLVTLARGDLADLAATGVATVTHSVNVSPYVSWTEGTLVFDATRLEDAVPRLERWYDVDIALSDSTLAGRRLTATFRHESLTQVLELLSLSLALHVDHHGRSIVLAP